MLKSPIKNDWRLYGSVDQAISGSDERLAYVLHRAIVSTSADLLSSEHSETDFSEISIKYNNRFVWKHRLWNGGHLVWVSMC